MSGKPLSQNAIGRELGLSPANMTKMRKQGCPMDSVDSVRAWRTTRQNIAARKPEPAQSYGSDDGQPPENCTGDECEGLDSARTRLMVADADIAEIKAAELAGRYVDKSVVERAVYEAARGLRDGMTSAARRLSAEVAALSTSGECEAAIAQEMRHLLDSFSRQLAQKISIQVAA